MQKQDSSIWLTIIVTAIIVAGISYYFWGNDKTKAVSVNSTNTTLNKSSKEYAVKGRVLWSAFQCSAWASINDKQGEAERLFKFGYEQGKEFFGAVNAQKISNDDMRQEVPIGVTMSAQGPNEDFMLGRIFEVSQDEALKEVFKTGDEFNSSEMQKIIAGNKFQDGNCQLIGK